MIVTSRSSARLFSTLALAHTFNVEAPKKFERLDKNEQMHLCVLFECVQRGGVCVIVQYKRLRIQEDAIPEVAAGAVMRHRPVHLVELEVEQACAVPPAVEPSSLSPVLRSWIHPLRRVRMEGLQGGQKW